MQRALAAARGRPGAAAVPLPLRVACEGFGADTPRVLLLDLDGAPEWWPINQVTRPAVPHGSANGSVPIGGGGSGRG